MCVGVTVRAVTFVLTHAPLPRPLPIARENICLSVRVARNASIRHKGDNFPNRHNIKPPKYMLSQSCRRSHTVIRHICPYSLVTKYTWYTFSAIKISHDFSSPFLVSATHLCLVPRDTPTPTAAAIACKSVCLSVKAARSTSKLPNCQNINTQHRRFFQNRPSHPATFTLNFSSRTKPTCAWSHATRSPPTAAAIACGNLCLSVKAARSTSSVTRGTSFPIVSV